MKLTDDFEDYGYENKYGKTILYTVLALLGVTVIVCAVVLGKPSENAADGFCRFSKRCADK